MMKRNCKMEEPPAKMSLSPNQIFIKKIQTGRTVRVNFDQPDINHFNQIKNMMPVFNRDNHFYTPAFQNEDDKIKTDGDRKIHKYMHNERLKNEINQIDEDLICLPKPSEKNSYCLVCKIRFEDYHSHLNQINHKKKFKKSKYNEHIEDLCRRIGEKEEEENKSEVETETGEPAKRKKIKKENETESAYLVLQKQTEQFRKKKNLDTIGGGNIPTQHSWLDCLDIY